MGFLFEEGPFPSTLTLFFIFPQTFMKEGTEASTRGLDELVKRLTASISIARISLCLMPYALQA